MDRYLNDRELGRVTLIIPVELKERAADHARREGMSLAALVRSLIIKELRRIGAMSDERHEDHKLVVTSASAATRAANYIQGL